MLAVEQQIFLQQMLGKGYILFEDAIKLMNNIVVQLNKQTNDAAPGKIGIRELKRTIKEINTAVKPEEIQLSITICEVTGLKYLTLHCIGHNDITEKQTFYSALELSYWLPVMEEIIKAEAKSMNRIECLNLVAKYQLQIKMDDAEKFLNKCTVKGYLVLRNGLYYLGSKAICEFNKDLRRTYEDYIHICELCSEICCYGKSCVNCNKQMHEYCLQAALSKNNECPLCHVEWGDFEFEGEQEEQRENDEEVNQVSDDTMSEDDQASNSVDVAMEDTDDDVDSSHRSLRYSRRNRT